MKSPLLALLVVGLPLCCDGEFPQNLDVERQKEIERVELELLERRKERLHTFLTTSIRKGWTLEGNISLQWNEENNAGLPTSVLIGNPFKEPLRVYANNTE